MSERDVLSFLQDMLEAAKRILVYTGGMTFAEFQQDFKTQDAVLRNLEVLGEAAKNIPEQIYLKYPTLPWREMAGTRDRLIHHYFGINLDVVWGIAELELPGVVNQLEVILTHRE
jgi:uncharacterized protein with HEPN domain